MNVVRLGLIALAIITATAHANALVSDADTPAVALSLLGLLMTAALGLLIARRA